MPSTYASQPESHHGLRQHRGDRASSERFEAQNKRATPHTKKKALTQLATQRTV